MISPYLTTMWYHMDGCTNQYPFTSDIYLLSCLALNFSIIIDIEVGEPRNGKYVVDGLSCRDKQMLKLNKIFRLGS